MKTIILSRFTSKAAAGVSGGDGGSGANSNGSGSGNVEQEDYKKDEESTATTTLTLWRKSLLFNCNGFTVIDSDGNLIYRVDNYMSNHKDEIVLMNNSGKPLLTMIRKVSLLRLMDNWVVYEGEVSSSPSSKMKPIFCVRKHKYFPYANSDVIAQVFHGSADNNRLQYVIQGSYGQRSCQVLDHETKKVVAEIKRKPAMIGGVSFGVDVFLLIVRQGFESRFAMAIVLLLDQMFS